MIGGLDFYIYDRGVLQYANFGYFIHNPHWGKGMGSEAALAGLKIAFLHLKLHRLEAAINLKNFRSQKLAKKIGMIKEGIRKHYWYENKKWTDQMIFSLTPEALGIKVRRPFRPRQLSKNK